MNIIKNDPIAISHSERIIPKAPSANDLEQEWAGSIEPVLAAVTFELGNAQRLFPPFNSAHEGYAVIAEELEELWDEIKANKGGTATTDNPDDMRHEAIQVAAMALRFIIDVCELHARR